VGVFAGGMDQGLRAAASCLLRGSAEGGQAETGADLGPADCFDSLSLGAISSSDMQAFAFIVGPANEVSWCSTIIELLLLIDCVQLILWTAGARFLLGFALFLRNLWRARS